MVWSQFQAKRLRTLSVTGICMLLENKLIKYPVVLPLKTSKLMIGLGFGFPVPRARSPLPVPCFSIILCFKIWEKKYLYNEVVTEGRRFVFLFVIFAFCLLKFTALQAFFLRAIQPPFMDMNIYARTGLLARDGLVIDKATVCSENSIFYC